MNKTWKKERTQMEMNRFAYKKPRTEFTAQSTSEDTSTKRQLDIMIKRRQKITALGKINMIGFEAFNVQSSRTSRWTSYRYGTEKQFEVFNH
jgi:hypothetical protein